MGKRERKVAPALTPTTAEQKFRPQISEGLKEVGIGATFAALFAGYGILRQIRSQREAWDEASAIYKRVYGTPGDSKHPGDINKPETVFAEQLRSSDGYESFPTTTAGANAFHYALALEHNIEDAIKKGQKDPRIRTAAHQLVTEAFNPTNQNVDLQTGLTEQAKTRWELILHSEINQTAAALTNVSQQEVNEVFSDGEGNTSARRLRRAVVKKPGIILRGMQLAQHLPYGAGLVAREGVKVLQSFEETPEMAMGQLQKRLLSESELRDIKTLNETEASNRVAFKTLLQTRGIITDANPMSGDQLDDVATYVAALLLINSRPAKNPNDETKYLITPLSPDEPGVQAGTRLKETIEHGATQVERNLAEIVRLGMLAGTLDDHQSQEDSAIFKDEDGTRKRRADLPKTQRRQSTGKPSRVTITETAKK